MGRASAVIAVWCEVEILHLMRDWKGCRVTRCENEQACIRRGWAPFQGQ